MYALMCITEEKLLKEAFEKMKVFSSFVDCSMTVDWPLRLYQKDIMALKQCVLFCEAKPCKGMKMGHKINNKRSREGKKFSKIVWWTPQWRMGERGKKSKKKIESRKKKRRKVGVSVWFGFDQNFTILYS